MSNSSGRASQQDISALFNVDDDTASAPAGQPVAGVTVAGGVEVPHVSDDAQVPAVGTLAAQSDAQVPAVLQNVVLEFTGALSLKVVEHPCVLPVLQASISFVDPQLLVLSGCHLR